MYINRQEDIVVYINRQEDVVECIRIIIVFVSWQRASRKNEI